MAMTASQAALVNELERMSPGYTPPVDTTVFIVNCLLWGPAVGVNLWTAWSAYTLVLVPLGAPVLSIWYIWALRLTIGWLRSRETPHDPRPSAEQWKEAVVKKAMTLVAGPVIVWWLLPWLIQGGVGP